MAIYFLYLTAHRQSSFKKWRTEALAPRGQRGAATAPLLYGESHQVSAVCSQFQLLGGTSTGINL